VSYSQPPTRHGGLARLGTHIDEPPPLIARVARNRGLTPIQTYLRLLQDDRIDLNDEVNRIKGQP
jgi:hypothetical protein